MTQPEVTYRHLDRKSHDEQVRESHDRQQCEQEAHISSKEGHNRKYKDYEDAILGGENDPENPYMVKKGGLCI
ncbi:Hypothetical predicted protein [Pelobates cultripes]|uniref:Uncharacterized protein n=1 Tax=Pelobates cultripes TaxID=61616 RepID=A0AAD1WZK2_PELCU|nr:Hypothetical predicted protein [Pelobates cultripes]